jgi:hypothetical protein
MTKQILITPEELDNNGGEGGLEIIIPGTKTSPEDDPTNPCPVFIEYYEGKIRVHIWTGNSDPQTIVLNTDV